jgi:hypothetical protein
VLNSTLCNQFIIKLYVKLFGNISKLQETRMTNIVEGCDKS